MCSVSACCKASTDEECLTAQVLHFCSQDFYGAAAGKSWLTIINGSSHMEFMNAGGALNWLFGLLCGQSGPNTFQVLTVWPHHPGEAA